MRLDETLALRSIMEWRERQRGGETGPLGVWRGTPYNVQRWKHKVGFHNRGVRWDTPMAKWAGEGNDWIKLMAQRKPHKEDVIRYLLETLKQAVGKKTEPNGTRPTKKPRDLPPLQLGIPEAGKWPTLELKGDCKTIVDWVNGHAKMKARGSTVEQSRTLSGNGGVVEFVCNTEPPSGLPTPFVNTTKKPTSGQTRALEGTCG